ncbi:MAG TPA: hypothetical protein VGD43_15385, partial [Micromonospora sp.]
EPTPTDRGRPVPSLTTPEPALTPPGPSSSPTGTTDDARSQAEVLDSLLDASAGSRKLLLRALQDAGNCINTVAAAQALDQVADERNTQLQQVRELRVTALRNGTQIQATLLEALTRSVEADRAFARWARGIRAEGCQQDGNYRDGVSASSAARAAKALFCSVWNPVAAGFGLPRRTLEEI